MNRFKRRGAAGQVPAAEPRLTPPLPIRESSEAQRTSLMMRAVSATSDGGVMVPIIDAANVQVESKIGQGGFGTVYRGKYVRDGLDIDSLQLCHGTDLAIKCLSNGAAQMTDDSEATMLAQLRHKNLVQFYGIAPSLVIKGEEGRCIITEFCSEGSLKDVLEQAEKDRVYGKETATVDKYGADWQTVWAKDIAQGMAYLHQGVRDYPIMHGDLKSLNILVSSEHKIKICDFGSAQNMVGSGLDSASKGTTPWNAPELINNPKGANENCDIWSYGVVLWELLTLKIPFEEFLSQDPNGFSLMFHLGHGWPKNAETAADAGEEPDPPLPIDNFPKSFQYVLRQCWQLDPTKRMKFDRIVGELDRGEKGQEAREFLNKKDEWEAQMQSEMAKVNEESKRLKEDMKRRDEDLEKKKSMIVDLEAQVMYMKYFMYGLIGMFVLIGVVWAVLYVSSGTEDAVSDKKANDIFKQDAGEDNFLDEAELDRALRKVLPHSQFLDTKRILASYDSNHTRGNTKLDRDEFENLVAHEQSQFGWLHRELSEQWHRRTGYNLPSLGAALRWTKEHMGGQTMGVTGFGILLFGAVRVSQYTPTARENSRQSLGLFHQFTMVIGSLSVGAVLFIAAVLDNVTGLEVILSALPIVAVLGITLVYAFVREQIHVPAMHEH